jgi:hypothetical protein
MKKTISMTPSVTLQIKRQHPKETLNVTSSTMTFSPSQLLKVVTVQSGTAATRDNMEVEDDEGFNSK